jgi:hypothetical protein
VAVVELVPESWRPYIGGSQENSFLELTFGYNGLGRITGNEVGSVGGAPAAGAGGTAGGFTPPGGAGGTAGTLTPPGGLGGPGGGGPGGGMWGQTGWSRLFDGALGTQIAWLIPAALLSGAVGLWWLRGRPRTDLQRASIFVWAGWLLVTAAVFSFMGGIFHEYYTVALAPAIAALVGLGGAMVWQRRDRWSAAALAAAVTAVTGWWAVELLGRADGWNPWLAPLVAVLAGAAAIGFVVLAVRRGQGAEVPPKAFAALGGVAVVAALMGPAAWTIQTVATSHRGGIVMAGPVEQAMGGPGGPTGAAGAGGAPGAPIGDGGPRGNLPTTGGAPTPPARGFAPGGAQMPPLPGDGSSRQGGPAVPGGPAAGSTGGVGTAPGSGGGQGGPGGLLDAAEPAEEVQHLLSEDAEDFDWVAATVGANNAAGYQLATELPVMPIGGFNGSDPSPTLEEFQQLVADGRIHWYVSTGGGFPGQRGGGSSGDDIDAWVTESFEQVTVEGTVLYDLTAPTGGD